MLLLPLRFANTDKGETFEFELNHASTLFLKQSIVGRVFARIYFAKFLLALSYGHTWIKSFSKTARNARRRQGGAKIFRQRASKWRAECDDLIHGRHRETNILSPFKLVCFVEIFIGLRGHRCELQNWCIVRHLVGNRIPVSQWQTRLKYFCPALFFRRVAAATQKNIYGMYVYISSVVQTGRRPSGRHASKPCG